MSATPSTEKAYGDFLERQLGLPDALLLVAVQAGMLIGYAYAGLEGADYMALRGPAGVVYDLIVAAPFRGQGLGARLLSEAIRALRTRGAPRVILSTAASNHAAQRLFSSFGFSPTMIEMTLDCHEPEQGKHARL
ncbi:GNAT family N-acetyltransferase [Caulobacter sp. BP25]|uniref:GNAT family N-acetyltransferase n=1 Tax=Caulobacter sp. BP25 TaxID=2048900 RepID=UPI00191B9ACC|nr:GNAT family N-acetyltransferase [Caulobacter sp. BP25]